MIAHIICGRFLCDSNLTLYLPSPIFSHSFTPSLTPPSEEFNATIAASLTTPVPAPFFSPMAFTSGCLDPPHSHVRPILLPRRPTVLTGCLLPPQPLDVPRPRRPSALHHLWSTPRARSLLPLGTPQPRRPLLTTLCFSSPPLQRSSNDHLLGLQRSSIDHLLGLAAPRPNSYIHNVSTVSSTPTNNCNSIPLTGSDCSFSTDSHLFITGSSSAATWGDSGIPGGQSSPYDHPC
jgi:hypothetical protein